jgi:hypothetical protein
MPLLEGMTLVNIVRTEIVTEETTPQTYVFETADEASVEPHVSEGQENILRVKNQILAIDRTEDIVVGYDLTFKDNTLIPELLALIDGGTLTYDDVETDKVVKYEGPESGKTVSRTKFTLNVYTEEKDESGDTVKYAKFIFKHCKGKPVEFTLKDGEFYVPELKAESRSKSGEKPVTIEFLDTLPAI